MRTFALFGLVAGANAWIVTQPNLVRRAATVSHMVPTSEYQIMASAASPPPLDSDHKKAAARWFREVLDPESDKFIDSKPNTPCFTPGTTTVLMVKRTEYKRMISEHVAWAKHGKDGCDGSYGDHYRMPDGTIDPANYIVLDNCAVILVCRY